MIIVADDITGAAEIAGICLQYGLQVDFGIDILASGQGQVKVVSTDSRSLTREAALEIHKRIAIDVARVQPDFVFKKCDSALRGYVLTEAMVLAETLKLNSIVVQPANPAAGRVIRDGCYLINGQVISQTAFGEDPDFPAFYDEVDRLLLRDIEDSLDNVIRGDCDSIEELVLYASIDPVDKLFVGSSAFFEQILINRFQLKKLADAAPVFPLTHFLMIVGSVHPTGKMFIAAQQEKYPVFELPSSFLQAHVDSLFLNDYARMLFEAWQTKKALLLHLPEPGDMLPASTKVLTDRLALLTEAIMHDEALQHVLVTGGATAYALFNRMGWKSLIPVEQYSPGVVRMLTEKATQPNLILKPGSYPWPNSII